MIEHREDRTLEPKVVVLGLGRIAWMLEDDPLREKPATHVGALLSRGDTRLVAGCDPDAERRQAFAERFGVPTYESAALALEERSPDLVIVAADTEAHARLVRLSLNSTARVVICEKPLTENLREARELVRRASKRSKTLIVNHERRYSLDYLQVKETIDSGDLGPVLSVRGTLYFGKTRDLESMLWHDGCHLFDVLSFLMNDRPLERVRKYRSETSMFVTATCGSTPVSVEIGRGRDHLAFELDLSFETGRIRVGNGIFSVERSQPSPLYSNYRSLVAERTSWSGSTQYFSRMMEDAVACVRDPSRVPSSSARTELATLKVLRRLTRKFLFS